MENINLASTKSKSKYSKELIQRFKAGETEAFGELYTKYQDKVYQLAYKYTENHEDASDISQEAFLRAFVGLKEFRKECAFYTWLYQITMNLCIDFHRKKLCDKTTSLDVLSSSVRRKYCVDFQPSPDRLALEQELHQKLHEAIRRLPQKQQAVFVLHYLSGLKTRKIAALIGCSEGTVKANLFYVRKKLKALLQPYLET